MPLIVEGLGTAVPAGTIEQEEAAATAARYCAWTAPQRRRTAALYRRSAVQRRGSVLIEGESTGDGDASAENKTRQAVEALGADRNNAQPFYPEPGEPGDRGPGVSERMEAYRAHALPLARAACERALTEAGVSADAVSEVVVVSCTGLGSPGLEVQLIDELRLKAGVGRTMIGFMGCHGALNGLRVARGLAAEPGGLVLLCAVELCSLHFQYGWDPEQIVANALFADGAGAVVARQQQSQTAIDSPSSHDRGDGDALQVIDSRSTVVPETRAQMQWHIGEYGFQMRLSPQVPEVIERELAPWLIAWLAEHDLGLADVGGWAIHPGGPRIIAAVERGLNLPSGAGDVSRRVLAERGNMSSPTVLFILDRLRAAELDRPFVALAFGPGLVVEGALIG
jgi:predicted naringenin-chalcone synthase